MKKQLKKLFSTTIIFFLFHSAFSQDKNVGSSNFSFDKGERKVYWIKVFEPTLSFNIETLKRYFTENNVLEIIEGDTSVLRGFLIPKPTRHGSQSHRNSPRTSQDDGQLYQ